MRYLIYLVLFTLVACSQPLPESYQPLPTPVALTDFALSNQDGNSVTKNDFTDKWSLVFFGFTYCPDVCPTTLAEMNRIAKNVERDNFQVVMISVDPERDTPEQLKSYMEYFNPKFQGWTGPLNQIEQLARQMHVFFQKQPHGDTYLMDHSSQIILVNPQGEYQGFITEPFDTQKVSDFINQL